jgi:hypothetical protein
MTADPVPGAGGADAEHPRTLRSSRFPSPDLAGPRRTPPERAQLTAAIPGAIHPTMSRKERFFAFYFTTRSPGRQERCRP